MAQGGAPNGNAENVAARFLCQKRELEEPTALVNSRARKESHIKGEVVTGLCEYKHINL